MNRSAISLSLSLSLPSLQPRHSIPAQRVSINMLTEQIPCLMPQRDSNLLTQKVPPPQTKAVCFRFLFVTKPDDKFPVFCYTQSSPIWLNWSAAVAIWYYFPLILLSVLLGENSKERFDSVRKCVSTLVAVGKSVIKESGSHACHQTWIYRFHDPCTTFFFFSSHSPHCVDRFKVESVEKDAQLIEKYSLISSCLPIYPPNSRSIKRNCRHRLGKWRWTIKRRSEKDETRRGREKNFPIITRGPHRGRHIFRLSVCVSLPFRPTESIASRVTAVLSVWARLNNTARTHTHVCAYTYNVEDIYWI